MAKGAPWDTSRADEEAALYPPTSTLRPSFSHSGSWTSSPRVRKSAALVIATTFVLFFTHHLLPLSAREWLEAVTDPETFSRSCKPLPWSFASTPRSGEAFSFDPEVTSGNIEMVMGCSYPSLRPSRPLLNHQDYAKAHYYGFTLYTLADDLPGLPGHSGTWIKVFGIRRRLKGELAKPAKDRIAWIAWTDMDTVILNFKIRFEDFLPPKEMAKPPFLVGVGDGNGYNSGVWFLSVSDRSLEFLETVIGVIDQPNPPELPYHEQTAMEMVVEAEQLVARKEVALVPREWIMSWEEEVSSGHKAFLVHLAGLTKKKFLPGYLALAEKRMEYQTTEERERLERERREYQEEARVYWEGWEARKMK